MGEIDCCGNIFVVGCGYCLGIGYWMLGVVVVVGLG